MTLIPHRGALAAPTPRAPVLAGELVLGSHDASRAFAEAARAWIEADAGAPLATLTDGWRSSDHARNRDLQRRFSADDGLLRLAVETITAVCGPPPFRVDRPRLRIVYADGHRVPEARPAYDLHRDTWFANPRAQLNLWIPLGDVDETTSFGLHPEAFGAPLANTSGGFDYAAWSGAGGFQGDRAAGKPAHPTVRSAPLRPPTRFIARAGDVLVFSAAHLHGTLPVSRTRVSVDLRVVYPGDPAAPDPNNASRGDASGDYVRV